MKDCSPLNSRKICDKMHFQTIQSESSDAFSDQSPTLARPPVPPGLESGKPPADMQFVNEEDVEALGAAAPPLPAIEDPKPPSASAALTASKTDSPSRKKGGKARGSQLFVCELGALHARVPPLRGSKVVRVGAELGQPSCAGCSLWLKVLSY